MVAATTRHPGGRPRSVRLSGLGERIETMARRRGLTRDDLARAAGMSKTGLWSVLTGRTKPKLATAAKLSAALRVPVEAMLD
jgi:transcriptional regulator with XRE-family HTH domain